MPPYEGLTFEGFTFVDVTGKKSEPIKYVTEQRYKEIQLENKFGKTEAGKVKPDVFKLPTEAFYRLIPQYRNIQIRHTRS